MQLFGDSDILSFVRIRWLNWLVVIIVLIVKEKKVKYLTTILREGS